MGYTSATSRGVKVGFDLWGEWPSQTADAPMQLSYTDSQTRGSYNPVAELLEIESPGSHCLRPRLYSM